MSCIKSGELIISELDQMSNEKLVKLWETLGFSSLSKYNSQYSRHQNYFILCTRLPTMCAKREEILKLYRSITTGVSQCHNSSKYVGRRGPPKNRKLKEIYCRGIGQRKLTLFHPIFKGPLSRRKLSSQAPGLQIPWHQLVSAAERSNYSSSGEP